MGSALAIASKENARSLAAVRSWWRVRHPPPSLGRRLDLLYTTAIVTGIFGLLAYGTASSALAQVVTPDWLARFGPSLALLALLGTAQWGAYHGPVVFSIADVAHLLGAPLPRRGLVARRLVLALGAGAMAGAVVAGFVIVGLAGEGRGIATDEAAGLTLGLAELGLLAVAATWAVERSARWEQAARRATWPGVLAAVALAAASDAGTAGRTIARWSGPWGWAVQAGAGAGRVAWIPALSLLTFTAAVAAVEAVRHSGRCPTERHMRRAEGHANAIASLVSFDARTARRSLEAVGARPARGRAAGLGRLRRALAGSGARAASALAVVWRDTVAAVSAPGRVIEAAALAGAGTAVSLLNADRPLAVAAAILLVYLGASRMLATLRSELDVTSRASILLRPRAGRVLQAHGAVPAVVATAAATIAAAACAIAGALPAHGWAAAPIAVAVTPILTCCAAMSARRGGRLPYSTLVTATAVDPSGGGLALVTWAASWPTLGVLLAGIPILLATGGGGAGSALAAVVWTAVATAAMVRLIGRDPTG
jgi:hypothetical protein